jgi:hypothetical protein
MFPFRVAVILFPLTAEESDLLQGVCKGFADRLKGGRVAALGGRHFLYKPRRLIAYQIKPDLAAETYGQAGQWPVRDF